MAENPILFSGQMVRAILDGRKTETRRVVKDLPNDFPKGVGSDVVVRKVGDFWCLPTSRGYKKSPYGGRGDLLWVRETWATHLLLDGDKPSIFTDAAKESKLWYRADGLIHEYGQGKWRPSIFMPRWASRITLRVTDVQVERLWQMSLYDMLAEGVYEEPDTDEHQLKPFIRLWNFINAKRGYGWDVNPWVWVVKFELVGGRR